MSLDMHRYARRTVAVLGLLAVTAAALPAQAATRGFPDHEGMPRVLQGEPERVEQGQRPAPPSQEEREKWEAMTPEERKAAHEQRREAFLSSLTPEQRQEHEARRAEFEKLSPEERKAKFGDRRPPHPGGPRQGQGGPRRGNGQNPPAQQMPQR